jgi:hypothetical protein
MKIVGAIAVLVFVPLVVMALHGSSPWLARKLVSQAARRLPEPFDERYSEEWLAELDAMPDGGVTTLVFAFCIRLRVGSMERKLTASSPPVPEQASSQADEAEIEQQQVLRQLTLDRFLDSEHTFHEIRVERTRTRVVRAYMRRGVYVRSHLRRPRRRFALPWRRLPR